MKIKWPSLQELVEDKSIPVPESGCWIWVGSVTTGGYGRYGKPRKLAHRLSYEAFVGEIPEGGYICHKCDTPACVNPAHLYAGDARTNALDAYRRGRMKKVREANLKAVQSTIELLSPSGEKRIITNVNAFCRDNEGLDASHLIAVYRGKRKSHKGWSRADG